MKEGIKLRKEHNIKNLFNLLPSEVQDEIKNSMEPEDLKINFDKYLDLNKDAFTNWRYFYEKISIETDLLFLRQFSCNIMFRLNKFLY